MSEKEYRLLFETSVNPIFITDPSGQFVDVNPAWRRLFGYSKAEATQLRLSDLYVDSEKYQGFWQQLKDQGSVNDFEARFHKKNKASVDCIITAAVRRRENDQISGYQGIMRDITLHKQAEQKLEAYHRTLEQKVKQRTEKLESQIEQLTAVNFITQMVASAHDTTTALETVAREMVHLFNVHTSGITLLNEERTKLTVVAYFTEGNDEPSPIGVVFDLAENPISQQVVNTGQTAVISADQMQKLPPGTQHILRSQSIKCLMILPLLSRAQVIGTIGVGADQPDHEFSSDDILLAEVIAAQIAGIIRNVRSFDEDLEHAYHKLQALDRLKSSFIGVITHEMRSPFVAADLSVQLLYRYLEKGMYADLLEQIKRLDQELTEGRRMIDSIISFAALMSKQGDLFLEETDLAELTKHATLHLTKIVEARNIELRFNFAPDLPLVRLDQQRISEAIHHLTHNAIKFSQKGSSVEIAWWATALKVVFEVKDTGVGISPEKLETIWQAFAQTADDVQRGVEGLGLGLPLVKYAIEAHGGQVLATSAVGQGSTFGFWLPVK